LVLGSGDPILPKSCCLMESFLCPPHLRRLFSWTHRAEDKRDPLARSQAELHRYAIRGSLQRDLGVKSHRRTAAIRWFEKGTARSDPVFVFRPGIVEPRLARKPQFGLCSYHPHRADNLVWLLHCFADGHIVSHFRNLLAEKTSQQNIRVRQVELSHSSVPEF